MCTERRDRGATIPFVAILLPVLILMTSFAIDLGRQRASRRDMQANADVIALDLARLADGRTEDLVIAGDVDHLPAATALSESAARNEIPDVSMLTLVFGTFTEASGFIACRALDSDGVPIGAPSTTCIPNAAQVTARETIDYFFQPGTGSTERVGVAAFGDPLAGFRIGSFAANLDPAGAGLLNTIITPLLGSPAGLSVLSYQGLAAASLGVGELGAELGLLTPGEVLDTEVGADELMLAAAEVLRRNGDTANADLLEGMITPEIESMDPISIGELVSAGPGGESAAMASSVNALDLVTATALLAQCTDPSDLSTCSGLAIPSISASLPLATVTGDLQMIQAPVNFFGKVGEGVDTSQVALDLAVELGTGLACVPVGLGLNCLVAGVIGGVIPADVSVTTALEIAEGRGTIDAIDCGTPLGLDIRTTTGLYTLTVDVVLDFGLLGTTVLRFSTDQPNASDLAEFDIPPDVFGVTMESTGSGSIGLSGLSMSTVSGGGVLGTVGSLAGMSTSTLIATLVNPIVNTLDATILGPLTNVLGVNVAGSDVWPLDVDCDGAGLKLVE